jgi:hypothetical protein
MGVELTMAKYTTNENGCVRLVNVQVNETIALVAQIAFVKVAVRRKKSWLTEREQKGNDSIIFDSLPRDLVANLTKRHMPLEQSLSLVSKYVFVENVHAGIRSTANSLACFKNASLDSFTASAIASSVMLLWHRSTMVSQSNPCETIDNTCHTIMRVPRKVGLP